MRCFSSGGQACGEAAPPAPVPLSPQVREWGALLLWRDRAGPTAWVVSSRERLRVARTGPGPRLSVPSPPFTTTLVGRGRLMVGGSRCIYAAEAASAVPVPRVRPTRSWRRFVARALPSCPFAGFSYPPVGLRNEALGREQPPGPEPPLGDFVAGAGLDGALFGEQLFKRERYLRRMVGGISAIPSLCEPRCGAAIFVLGFAW